jgi:hypothetical protein
LVLIYISEVLLPTVPLLVIKTNQDFHSDFIYNRYIHKQRNYGGTGEGASVKYRIGEGRS